MSCDAFACSCESARQFQRDHNQNGPLKLERRSMMQAAVGAILSVPVGTAPLLSLAEPAYAGGNSAKYFTQAVYAAVGENVTGA